MNHDNVIRFATTHRTRIIFKEQKVDVSKISTHMFRDINKTIANVQAQKGLFRNSHIHAVIAYLQQGWEPDEISNLLP